MSESSAVFQLRTYLANEGKLDLLNGRFRDHTLGFFKKHGMESVGYWLPTEKPNALVYVLKHGSRDAAQASWDSFRADPGWKKVFEETEKDGRFLVSKPESVFMAATDYSPPFATHLKDDEGVYELRTYVANEGKLDRLNGRFRDHTLRMFEKHGMASVSYWVPTDGPGSKNTLIYLLKHKSRDAAMASWEAFKADSEWKKISEETQKDGRFLAGKPESVFMKATDYSRMLWKE